jgi:4-amino-4-deoxy-L-arabinose transferase-like glycosyltransferase
VPFFRLPSRSSLVVFACATLIAGLALAVDLGSWDVENDEAIYTYAVERMIDTGDWMTPREIPHDYAFLEKPPLKLWLVAAPIRLGLLPRTEVGFRAIDALLGAIAFGYVALLAYRLAGPAAAVASCLILFGMRDLVLHHGLRSNNMESPLVAAYAGGLYHFLRWRHDGMRQDALMTGAWFTLAFLTKFVAAAFLPLVAVVSLTLPRPRLLPKPWRASLADWVWAAALFVLVSAPWFIYEYRLFGDKLIETMFRQHVFARFTGALDPRHLHPWDYYLREIARLLADARCDWLVVAGAIVLLYRVVRWRDGLAWTVLVWGVLPLALISALTSKLLHYSYPFLAPLAIAGGVALAAPLGLLKEPLERLAGRLERAHLFGLPALLARPRARQIGLAIGSLAIALAALALVFGTTKIVVAGLVVRNSSVMRPLAVAAICFALTRAWRHVLTIVPVALMALFPLGAARETLIWGGLPRHAMRAIRDCARPLADAGRIRGAFALGAPMVPHTYAFYFLPLGGWQQVDAPDLALARQAILEPGAQRPILLTGRGFSDLGIALLREGRNVPPAVSPYPGWVVLLPGPLGACVDPMVRGGGHSIGGPIEGGP